jgi:hypothetical protein
MIQPYEFDNANAEGDKEAVILPNIPSLINKLSANEINGIRDKLNEILTETEIVPGEVLISGFFVETFGKTDLANLEDGDHFRGWYDGDYYIGLIIGLPVSLPADLNDETKVELAISKKAADSDKLDGLSADQYLRSDAEDVKTSGKLKFSNDVKIRLDNASEIFGVGNISYWDIFDKINFRNGIGMIKITINQTGDIVSMGDIEANSFKLGNWTIETSGTSLVFRYNGVNKASLGSDGKITATSFFEG